MKAVSARELATWLADDMREKPLLLDVREPWEAQICRIDGSGLVPMQALAARLPDIERERPIVCICHHGGRSAHVAMFLARHGYGHTIPPHEVNYRANLWALKEQGAKQVISVASVGSIRADLSPGDIVVPDQILDYTYGRAFTYFEGHDQMVTHIDFTFPYDQKLRLKILEAARNANEECFDGGAYAAIQGPRLETAAEINRYERDGADMVGMTGMPEAALAMSGSTAMLALPV